MPLPQTPHGWLIEPETDDERAAPHAFVKRWKGAAPNNRHHLPESAAAIAGVSQDLEFNAPRTSRRCWLDVALAEQHDDFIDGCLRGTDLVGEDAAKLFENDFGSDELVIRHYDSHYIRTEASGSERADEHVRVEEHPQEISSNTSSSVR